MTLDDLHHVGKYRSERPSSTSESKTLPATVVKSLRDQKKSRIRHLLRDSARKLFATQGFDVTTIDQIAKAAGISTRTFFRYFPTKEAVVFLDDHVWVDSFVAIYLDQPAAMADVDAICATFVELASKFRHHRPSSRLFERVVVSSPTLRGRIRERQEGGAKHIAGAIATRRGLSRADEASLLMADIAQETHRRALIAWRDQTTGELGDAIVEEFALLNNTFLMSIATRSVAGPSGASMLG